MQNSNSQAGQDQLVAKLLVMSGRTPIGTFLDIGCNHPVKLSNTYMLEQLGWMGYLFDNDDYCVKLCREERKNAVIQADTISFDWRSLLGGKHFSYLSLDVDESTLPTLKALLDAGISWDVATIEHDSYRFGPTARDTMRELLLSAGYAQIALDVTNEGMPYEDWWIIPGILPKDYTPAQMVDGKEFVAGLTPEFIASLKI